MIEPLTPLWAELTLPLMYCVLPAAPLLFGLVIEPISDEAPPVWPSAFVLEPESPLFGQALRPCRRSRCRRYSRRCTGSPIDQTDTDPTSPTIPTAAPRA